VTETSHGRSASIATLHLDLRPLPAAAARLLPDDRGAAAIAIGAALSPSWPQPDLLDVLPIQAVAAPEDERSGIWLMIEHDDRIVVGDVGFHGPPHDGVVEIGFSVVPERRRLGYATEAARGLVAWALMEPTIRTVIARCEPDNVASIRVLEAVGFDQVGQSDGLIHWRAGAS